MVHLKTFTVGQEVTHMVGITMTETCRPQSVTVIIHRHRAVHHLIATVAIKVGHVERVVALTGIGTVGLAVLVGLDIVIGIELPHTGQFTIGIAPALKH